MKGRVIRFDKETVGIVLDDTAADVITWVDISDGKVRTYPINGEFSLVTRVVLEDLGGHRFELERHASDSLGRILLHGVDGEYAYVGEVRVC
jgi:hypothetical protein